MFLFLPGCVSGDFCNSWLLSVIEEKGVANTIFSLRAVEENQVGSLVSALFCQRSCRNVVDDKGIFLANFFRGGRLRKTTFAWILDTFPLGWVPFCTSWAAWAPRWVRASILGRFLDAPGVALGGLGAPLESLGAPSGVPSGQKSETNTELCDRYAAKPDRRMKTGSPDPLNGVKT